MAKHRIGLVHALSDSVAPAHRALDAEWPDAEFWEHLEPSLVERLVAAGGIDQAINDRFLEIGRDAVRERVEGILFTCSAFGPSIDGIKRETSIPILKPNEAAIDDALTAGSRIGIVVTFEPVIKLFSAEIEARAAELGKQVAITHRFANGALTALKGGNAEQHDDLIAVAARTISDVDCVVLAQFSMASAAAKLADLNIPVITTPGSAVRRIKRMVEEQA